MLRAFISSLLGAALTAGAAVAQVGGNLAALPAIDVEIAITTGADGVPVVTPEEIRLVTGDYYRFNITSDGGRQDGPGAGADWRVEADDLLQNSHLRVLTVDDVEVHLQGLMFRAIEFDEAGAASFTLTPIRPGAYEIYVGPNPLSLGRPIGEAGPHAGAPSARVRVVVE